VNHADHVRLIEPGIAPNCGGVWADFGAGSGAFTLALRDIAGPDIDLIAIDLDRASLQTLNATMERRFPGSSTPI
jgi:precorrin-6B methylase 2